MTPARRGNRPWDGGTRGGRQAVKPPSRLGVLVVLCCLLPRGAGALGLSYGGGLGLNFSPVTFTGTYSSIISQVTSQASSTTVQFFDATYALLQVGYVINRGSTEPGSTSSATAFAAVLTGISVEVSLKLPVRLGPVEIFPIAGVEYVLNLTYTDDKGHNLRDVLAAPGRSLDELWLKGGIGVDIFLGGLFVRPMVMAGFKPYAVQAVDATLPTSTPPPDTINLALGSWTIDACILFGYRF